MLFNCTLFIQCLCHNCAALEPEIVHLFQLKTKKNVLFLVLSLAYMNLVALLKLSIFIVFVMSNNMGSALYIRYFYFTQKLVVYVKGNSDNCVKTYFTCILYK